jgi:hypothetical protein
LSSTCLPTWLQYAQALALPIIPLLGAWIALQQMLIARIKLQHDLYDRRYAVFDGAREFLSQIMTDGVASQEALRDYTIATGDAVFLLDDDLVAYLKEIRQHAADQRKLSIRSEQMPNGPQQDALMKEEDKHLDWLSNQFGVLVEKFKPVLRLDRDWRWSRPWLLVTSHYRKRG